MICQLLHQGLAVHLGQLVALPNKVTITPNMGTRIPLKVAFSTAGISLAATYPEREFQFSLPPGVASPFPFLIQGLEPLVDSSTAECLSSVAALVQECDFSHQKCARKGEPALPRRVIEICDQQPESLRLRESNHARGKYIALSHCWGKGQKFTTTRASIAQRYAGITLGEMPKSYRDSITLAKMLSIRYVWIDSLCIVQDDRYVFFPSSHIHNQLSVRSRDPKC